MGKRKITNQSRHFKGVWIPAEYWLDPNLTMMEIMFITEIDSLDHGEGCFASNSHFADFFGVTPGRASQIIKSLEKKGYIELGYERNGKQVVRRLIRVVRKLKGVFRKLNEGIKFSKGGYLENAEGSNTLFSNTESNTEEGSKAGQSPAAPSPVNEEEIPYKEIIDYLNQKTGKNFKHTTKKHREYIKAIWDSGFRLDDFKKVVDNKCSDWLGVTSKDGQDMTKYLRPKTIFAAEHFDDYLNEKGKSRTSSSSAYDSPEYHNLFANQWQPQNDDDLPF